MSDFDREDLMRLLDGDLSRERRAEVEDLVGRVPEAKDELAMLRAADRLVERGLADAFPRQTADAALTARIGETVRRSQRRGRLIRAAVGWSAAASVFFAVVIGVPKYRTPDTASPGIATLLEADDSDYTRLEDAMYDFEDF